MTANSVPNAAPHHAGSALKYLWEDRVARAGIIILLFMYFCALFADPLTPCGVYFTDPDLANAPPTIIHLSASKAPYVYSVQRAFDPATLRQIYRENPSTKYPVKMFCKGESYKILGIIGSNVHLFGVDAPARIFLAGTDIAGHDNFSRLFFGAQKSLTIGFLGLLVAFPIGIVYGGVSGFFGGWIDNLMMRVAEAIMSIPSFYLLIGLAAILPPGMSGSQRFALITVILSLIGWAGLARVIRGMVLSWKEHEFVQAARAAGMPEFTNIFKHVIPQTTSFIIVAATLQVPSFILSESGLSFIGLGIQPPDASWGNMLKAALDNVEDLLSQPWLVAPGVLIFLTILCFNSIGDVLRDVLDPRFQKTFK